MARYMVHVRGEGPEALAGARFLRDGFSWPAFAFGAIWLFAKGAWVSGLLALAALIGLGLLMQGLGILLMFPLASALLGFLIALESGAIRAWELEIRGYRLAGIISGDDREVMESRFFEEALAERLVPASSAAAYGDLSPPAASGRPVIGLFPSPARQGAPRP